MPPRPSRSSAPPRRGHRERLAHLGGHRAGELLVPRRRGPPAARTACGAADGPDPPPRRQRLARRAHRGSTSAGRQRDVGERLAGGRIGDLQGLRAVGFDPAAGEVVLEDAIVMVAIVRAPGVGRTTAAPPRAARPGGAAALGAEGSDELAPSGRPAAVQCSGTLIAGRPVRFASWVNGTQPRFSVIILSRTPAAEEPGGASSMALARRGFRGGRRCRASRSAGGRGQGGGEQEVVAAWKRPSAAMWRCAVRARGRRPAARRPDRARP